MWHITTILSKSGMYTQNKNVLLCCVCFYMSICICMYTDKPNTCRSTGSNEWDAHFKKKVRTLQPGSPCNDFKGYCDVFMKCRLVDADGPLARLKKAIFNPELYKTIAEWIVVSTAFYILPQ